MKVLQLIDSLDAGGAERMAVNIANATMRAGIDSYLCSTVRSGPLEAFIDPNVTFNILHKRRKIDMQAFSRFFKYIKDKEINIIHAHSTSIQLAVLTKMRFPNIKVVWHNHYGLSTVLKSHKKLKIKTLSGFVNTAIVVNESLKNWTSGALGVDQVYYLKNFITFSKEEQEETTLLGTTGKRVLCLANLRIEKNHIELIKAFQKSIKDFPEWTLHLVGKDFNDEYSLAVKNTVSEFNLEKSVFFYGSCPDVEHILYQATIGVLASTAEGLPLALLEYGSTGLPVITTNVGQCAEVVGDHGIVISNVAEKMPQALIQFYSNLNNERELKGLNFQSSIRKHYSEDAFMNALFPIYKELLT